MSAEEASNEAFPQNPAVLNHLFSHTLKLYKSNRLIPDLEKDDLKYIKRNISNYLFTNYQRQSRDLIIRTYTSAREVYGDLKLIIREDIQDQFHIRVLLVKCRNKVLISNQALVFITNRSTTTTTNDDEEAKTYNTLVLAKSSPLHQLIISSLNNLQCDPPLIIANHELSGSHLYKFVNHVFESRLNIQDVHLTYTLNNGSVINDNLRNIVVSIPQSNLQRFKVRQQQQQQQQLQSEDEHNQSMNVMTVINEFLYHHSKVNFNHLSITKFISNVVNISVDGKIKIKSLPSLPTESATSTAHEAELQWMLIKNFYELLS